MNFRSNQVSIVCEISICYIDNEKKADFFLVDIITNKIQQLEEDVNSLTASTRKTDCFRNEMPSNCQDLQCIGYKLNGFYLVREANNTKIETIYCDFSEPYAASNSGAAIRHKT